MELVYVAVKLVGAGLGHYVDHGAGVAAVLGIEAVGEDAELFHAVRAGLDCRQVREHVIGDAAVNAEIVGAATATVDGDAAGAACTKIEDRSATRSPARLQGKELICVALVQGKLDNSAVINDGAELRAAGLD